MMENVTEQRERWVTTKDVCKYLGIGRHTVLAWMEKWNMPGRKIGGTWRFKISEIDEWMKNTQFQYNAKPANKK